MMGEQMDDGCVDRWVDGEMDDRWGEQVDDGQQVGKRRRGRDSLFLS